MQTIKVDDRRFKLYMTAEEIATTVQRVAKAISSDYRHRSPIICPVLTGSFAFAADLVRAMDIDSEVCFVRYSSYQGMQSSGTVAKVLGFPPKVKGRDVIIVEDIVDTGISMEHMLHELQALQPASVSICTLFFKPDSFKKDFKIDYIGKAIANDFIVGYGLDYNEYGRGYSDVYVVEP